MKRLSCQEHRYVLRRYLIIGFEIIALIHSPPRHLTLGYVSHGEYFSN
jgi:hypothetical protein